MITITVAEKRDGYKSRIQKARHSKALVIVSSRQFWFDLAQVVSPLRCPYRGTPLRLIQYAQRLRLTHGLGRNLWCLECFMRQLQPQTWHVMPGVWQTVTFCQIPPFVQTQWFEKMVIVRQSTLHVY